MSYRDAQDFFEAMTARLAARLHRRRPVFITGRFRSGTSALWNILRQEQGTFGIYEPLHDSLPAYLGHQLPTDGTHCGVEDYFRELRPHRAAVLERYRPEFGTCRLTLAAGDAYPELKAYLDRLVELAGPKIPLFKFVRMDFRLPWLRRQYPDAVVIHIHRNPREQWLSMRARESADFAEASWLSVYQLNTFAASQLFCLPEIFSPEVQSSYERAYYLSRISRAVGEKYADLSINFERDFLGRDDRMFARLGRLTGIPVLRKTLNTFLNREIPPRAPAAGTTVPFVEIEQKCDEVLARRGLLRAIADGALETAWPVAADVPRECVVEAINCLSLSAARQQTHSVNEGENLRQTREILRQALTRVESLQDRAERAEAALHKYESAALAAGAGEDAGRLAKSAGGESTERVA